MQLFAMKRCISVLTKRDEETNIFEAKSFDLIIHIITIGVIIFVKVYN